MMGIENNGNLLGNLEPWDSQDSEVAGNNSPEQFVGVNPDSSQATISRHVIIINSYVLLLFLP